MLIKRLLKVIGFLSLALFLLFLGFILLLWITEFRPPPVINLSPEGTADRSLDSLSRFTIMSWNIGYGGLGEKMDFFYDGGTRSRPEAGYFTSTWDRITLFLSGQTGLDAILLQEIDQRAHRSHYLDEPTAVRALFPGMVSAFAVNYNCLFLPLPVTQPMGRVLSGLLTLSSHEMDSAIRYGFTVHPPLPDRLVQLKRCFLATWIPLQDNRSLVVVNVHNSAFDTGGLLRPSELDLLSRFMQEEANKGNFVVAGGDWNANPPGFSPDAIATGDGVFTDPFYDLSRWFPSWTFAWDPAVPTNRHVDKPYRKGVTETSILDFFVLSPNLELISVETRSLGFLFSDHNPVFITFRARETAAVASPQIPE